MGLMRVSLADVASKEPSPRQKLRSLPPLHNHAVVFAPQDWHHIDEGFDGYSPAIEAPTGMASKAQRARSARSLAQKSRIQTRLRSICTNSWVVLSDQLPNGRTQGLRMLDQ